LDNPKYRKGDITTKFLDEEYPGGFQGHPLDKKSEEFVGVAAAILRFSHELKKYPASVKKSTTASQRDFVVYVKGYQATKEAIKVNLKLKKANAETNEDIFEVTVGDGAVKEFTGLQSLRGFSVNGTVLQVLDGGLGGLPTTLQFRGTPYQVTVATSNEAEVLKFMKEKPKKDTTRLVLAPMPGVVVEILVKEGDPVHTGKAVAVLEAMKMRNVLHSARDGKVKKVNVQKGKNVNEGDSILEFE